MHVSNVGQVFSKCWNKPNVTCKSGSALRDQVTRVIIVLFVGGQVTNVEQNNQITTDFPAHK